MENFSYTSDNNKFLSIKEIKDLKNKIMMMLNLPYQLKLKRFTKKDITKVLSFLNDKNLLKYSDQRHINHNYKIIKYLNCSKKSKSFLKNNFK